MTAANVAGSLATSKCEPPEIQDNKRNSGTSGADYRDDDDAGGQPFRRRRVEAGRAGGSGWRPVFMFDACVAAVMAFSMFWQTDTGSYPLFICTVAFIFVFGNG